MYVIIDEIFGEKIIFKNKYDCEKEAQHRLSLHHNGYNIRHNHISGCDAILKIEGKQYFILIKEQ